MTNVWTLLLADEDEALALAENTIAAAIGSDHDGTLLIEQLGLCIDHVFEAPDQSKALLRLLAAFAGIGRGFTAVYGELAVEDDGDEPTDERRDAEVRLLSVATEYLRNRIAGDGDT